MKMMEVQMAQVEMEAQNMEGEHQQMLLQHQQMLYTQIQQEQQNYMMQMNQLQYALQNLPAQASAEEEADMEKELDKFTNGAVQSEKSKAKISKIEKLFERPADASDTVYLQDEGFIVEDLPRAVHLIDMFGAGRFKSNVQLLEAAPDPEEAEQEPPMPQYGKGRGDKREMSQPDQITFYRPVSPYELEWDMCAGNLDASAKKKKKVMKGKAGWRNGLGFISSCYGSQSTGARLTAPIPNQLFSVITAQTGDASSSGMTWVDGVTVLPPDQNGSNLLPIALLTTFAPSNFSVTVEGNLLTDRAVHAVHFPNQISFGLDRPLSFNDLEVMSQIRKVISSTFSDAGTKASIAATLKDREEKEAAEKAADEEEDGEETGTQNRRRRYRDEIVPLISDSTSIPQLLKQLTAQVGTCPWPNSRLPKGKRGFAHVINPAGKEETELFPAMLDLDWLYQEELRKQREEEERRRQKELEKQRLRQEQIRREKERKERERMERERKKQEEKAAALAAKKGKGKGGKKNQNQAPSSPSQQNQGWGGNWGGNEQQQQWSPKPKQQQQTNQKNKKGGLKGQNKGGNAYEYPSYHGPASGQGMNFNQLAQQFLQANQNNPNLFHQPQHSQMQPQQQQQPPQQGGMPGQYLMQNFGR
jgi:hypothetical protein